MAKNVKQVTSKKAPAKKVAAKKAAPKKKAVKSLKAEKGLSAQFPKPIRVVAAIVLIALIAAVVISAVK